MLKYPKVGSRWEIQIGPQIPRSVFEVIGAGHGSVAVKAVDSEYRLRIDVTRWHDGPYMPVELPTTDRHWDPEAGDPPENPRL